MDAGKMPVRVAGFRYKNALEVTIQEAEEQVQTGQLLFRQGSRYLRVKMIQIRLARCPITGDGHSEYIAAF
jgi:hypothetical protein